MAEIKTRILLRNDTLANWKASPVVLKKGEIAIATLDGTLAEVRVGDNTSWANSRKLRVEAGQISGLIDTINTQVSGIAQEYQLTAGIGDNANKWFLQTRPLSGGNWTTKSTLDLTQLTGYALSTDVTTLVAAVSADTLNAAKDYTNEVSAALSAELTAFVADVSAETLSVANDYTDDKIDALSINNYMLTADFNAISNEIGLSAASASNPVVTKDDIKDLASAMHFRGAVTPNEGETDLQALARVIEDPASGDLAIITTTSKEYVYNGTSWIELGDEVLYATKAEVNTVSAQLTSDIADLTADVGYLSGVIDDTRSTLNTVSSDYLTSTDKTELETLVGTVSAETLTSANAYTDSKIGGLSTTVDTLVAAVSAEAITSANAHTDAAIDALNIKTYALSADVNTLVATVSAATVTSANGYTDGKITDLHIENYALSADVNALVGAVSAQTLVSANAHADAAVAALSIDDYIKHGEVIASDLSGYFVFDCGTASYRDGEEAATHA